MTLTDEQVLEIAECTWRGKDHEPTDADALVFARAILNAAALSSSAKVGGDEREAFEAWFKRGGSGLADCWAGACEWQRAALSADGGDRKDAERYRLIRSVPTMILSQGAYLWGEALDVHLDAAIAAKAKGDAP